MGALAKLFTLPSASRGKQEAELGNAEARGIIEDAGLEQKAILDEAAAVGDAARFNAGILRRNAKLAVENASIDASRLRREARRTESSQRAAIAGSGFTSSGFDDLVADSAAEDEMDALLVQRRGRLNAEDFLKQAELQIRGAGDASRGAAIRVRGSAEGATRAARAAILTGQTRARAARAERAKAIIDTAQEIATSAIAPGSNFNRFRKVIF